MALQTILECQISTSFSWKEKGQFIVAPAMFAVNENQKKICKNF